MKRPTSLNQIPTGIGKIITIDETGTPNLNPIQKALQHGTLPDDSERTFTVTACSINVEDYSNALASVYALKCKYWENGFFDYGNNDIRRVCFHSREIRRREGPFHPTIINHPAFITDLSEVMRSIPMELFASHINKVDHVMKYSHPKNPYSLCFDFVIERIVMSNSQNKPCVVILESRGKNEDCRLLEHINNLLHNGTNWMDAQRFSCIKGVFFNPKWATVDNKKASYWQLEIADLCAYPIYKHCAKGINDKAFQVIENKFCHYPNYLGYGLKTFP